MKRITLSQASKSVYYKKTIQLEVIVTGKALIPYYVPKKIVVSCNPKRSCKKCPVVVNENTLTLEVDNPNFIKFIGTTDLHMPTLIRNVFEINPRCLFKPQVESMYTVEEVYLNDVYIEKNVNHVSRIGYVVNKQLECNIPYLITCYTVPETKQQKISHIITEAEKQKTDIESFTMTHDVYKSLRSLRPQKNDPESMYEFLENLYDIYSSNITKIYKRFDLHMSIDLVFHSPLQFWFNNEFIHKGWLDVMILGDTRCGKGYVSENLVKYYGVGELVSGENLSFAGLVGGVQQLSGRWVVTWGKIPLNNKRLVIVDESGEMDSKDFSRLSRIRSEGIAEITKIQTERVPAMTRLIFLTNPRTRLISSYSFGIEAVTDIVENTEDIARFDYVLVLAQDEVNINEINQSRKEIKNPYKNIDPILIQWIWSRTPQQVQFTPEATALILKYAIKLGGIYSSQIPLIQGENIRMKLAKISAAIAGRLYSSDTTGEILIIKEHHVECAMIFLNIIYKKQASSYFYYSKIQKQASQVHDEENLEKYFSTFETRQFLIDYFLQNNYITVTDLSEHINQPKDIAREVISKLLYHKCIQKKYTFYVKNQAFTDWLRRSHG